MWLKLLTNTTILKLVARHIAAGIGVYVVNQGIVTGKEWEDAVGAILALVAIGHSVLDKRQIILNDINNILNQPK